MTRLLTLLTRFDSAQSAGALSPLLILTDEARGYDLGVQLSRAPQGALIIDRTFGHRREKKVKAARSFLQLATCTPRQARMAALDGVHWPQKRLKFRAKSATRGLIETASAHSGLALAQASRLGLDAILVSTAFKSNSPSATRPLGAIRLARLQRAFPHARLYALGGITIKTAKSLSHAKIAGVALVSFLDEGC